MLSCLKIGHTTIAIVHIISYIIDHAHNIMMILRACADGTRAAAACQRLGSARHKKPTARQSGCPGRTSWPVSRPSGFL